MSVSVNPRVSDASAAWVTLDNMHGLTARKSVLDRENLWGQQGSPR